MPDMLLVAVQFGGYISIARLISFLVVFFAWLWLVRWANEDAKYIASKDALWTAISIAAGAIGALLFLIIPVFFVGLMLFIIAVAATTLSYVMHRNALVPEFEKVLTPDHIKGLFSSTQKKGEGFEDLIFITVNDNEISPPEPRTKEFFGFKVAHDLFKDIIYRRAANVILLPNTNSYTLSYIVDGAALEQPNMTKDKAEQFTNFLKQLAGLDLSEKRKPQKGTFRITQKNAGSQWEIATAGSTAGEQVRLKLVTQDTAMRLSEINLLPEQYQQLEAVTRMKKGLFLISGPKQSGITTTFYALLRSHDAFINSINTLELNPTIELPNVVQDVFSLSNTGTSTYAKRLLSIVRMSPDVLGAVDIKDTETAKVVCHAAKEGAIVYATIEADSIITAIGKMLKLLGDKKRLAETIIGASNQRLVRKLCPECKIAYEPNKELLRKFNIPPEKAKVLYREGKLVYDKRGKGTPCQTCHEIGYFGRTCVFETILMNNELKRAIFEANSLQELAMQFRKARMKYLQEQMLERVLQGVTSVDEMIRVLSPPKKARPRPADKD
jgi:type II secretory ATPase GspE/PulE/Tfp pilus assembly ATPase PilB-like protein